jgi:hypothetical protein
MSAPSGAVACQPGTDEPHHSGGMDDTDRLRDAWDEAERLLANASNPSDVAALRARAEAAEEAYLRAEEADAIERRTDAERLR